VVGTPSAAFRSPTKPLTSARIGSPFWHPLGHRNHDRRASAAIDSRHWVFEGTGLEDGSIFGQASLHERIPGGASGHETDKISPSSPKNVKLLAQGMNPDKGGADMVIHEPGGGGAVFSAGSITWPASILVDDAVSRITSNVLRRFSSR
jgi:hypothetical protein